MKVVDFYDQGLNMHRTLSEWVVERDGFYYQRNSDVPFNGTVTGNEEGLINFKERCQMRILTILMWLV